MSETMKDLLEFIAFWAAILVAAAIAFVVAVKGGWLLWRAVWTDSNPLPLIPIILTLNGFIRIKRRLPFTDMQARVYQIALLSTVAMTIIAMLA